MAATAPSRSSQKAKNVALALLAIWSIVSLVVIVVWATSPDLKSSAQCRAELQDTREKMEGAKVVWRKDRVALEEKVEEERDQQQRLTQRNLLLLGQLSAANGSLEKCRHDNVVLNTNISVLQENVEQLKETEVNLTSLLDLKQENIDTLEQNLTQAGHQTQSCFNLKDAAQSQMVAAQIQTKACQSNQQYLQKQLHKCKSPEPSPTEGSSSTAGRKSSAPPLTALPAVVLLVCSTLHLFTCEYDDDEDHHL